MKKNPIYKAIFSLSDALPSTYKAVQKCDKYRRNYALVALPPITDWEQEHPVAVHLSVYEWYKTNENFNNSFSIAHFTFQFLNGSVHVNYNRFGQLLSIKFKRKTEQDKKPEHLTSLLEISLEMKAAIAERAEQFSEELLLPLLGKVGKYHQELAENTEKSMNELLELSRDFIGKNPEAVRSKETYLRKLKECVQKIESCNTYSFSSLENPLDLRYKFLEKIAINLETVAIKSVQMSEIKKPVPHFPLGKPNKKKKSAQAKKKHPAKKRSLTIKAIDLEYLDIERKLISMNEEVKTKPIETLLSVQNYLSSLYPLKLNAENAIKVFVAMQKNYKDIEEQFYKSMQNKNLEVIKKLATFITFLDPFALEKLIFSDALEAVDFLLNQFPMMIFVFKYLVFESNTNEKTEAKENLPVGILQKLIQLNRLEMLKIWLKYPQIDYHRNPVSELDGSTPLLTAIQEEKPDIVALLLDKKADPNFCRQPEEMIWSKPINSIKSGKDMLREVKRESLRKKITPHQRLRSVQKIKQTEFKSVLIITPLHAAIEKGNLEIVQLLLNACANPKLQESLGSMQTGTQKCNAIGVLTCYEKPKSWMLEDKKMLRFNAILNVLLQAKADINALQDFSNGNLLRSPLFYNIEIGRVQIVKSLLQAKADVDLVYTDIDPISKKAVTALMHLNYYFFKNKKNYDKINDYKSILGSLTNASSNEILACNVAIFFSDLPAFTLTVPHLTGSDSKPILLTYTLSYKQISFSASKQFCYSMKVVPAENQDLVVDQGLLNWIFPKEWQEKLTCAERFCAVVLSARLKELSDVEKRVLTKKLMEKLNQALKEKNNEKVKFFSKGILFIMIGNLNLSLESEDLACITQVAEYFAIDVVNKRFTQQIEYENPETYDPIKFALLLKVVYLILERPWDIKEQTKYPGLQSIFAYFNIDQPLEGKVLISPFPVVESSLTSLEKKKTETQNESGQSRSTASSFLFSLSDEKPFSSQELVGQLAGKDHARSMQAPLVSPPPLRKESTEINSSGASASKKLSF